MREYLNNLIVRVAVIPLAMTAMLWACQGMAESHFEDHYPSRPPIIADAERICLTFLSEQNQPNRLRSAIDESSFASKVLMKSIRLASLTLNKNGFIGSVRIPVYNSNNRINSSYGAGPWESKYKILSVIELTKESYGFRFYLGHPLFPLDSLATVFLDKDCKRIESRFSFYDEDDKLSFRIFVNSKNEVFNRINVRPMPVDALTGLKEAWLKDSTHQHPEQDIPKPEDLQKIQDKQRITVAFIDTGVDYNHPDLVAFLRPNLRKLNEIKKIQQNLNSLSKPLSFWDRVTLRFTNPEWSSQYTQMLKKLEAETNNRFEREQIGYDGERKDFFPYDYKTSEELEMSPLEQPHSFDHGTFVAGIIARSENIRLFPIRLPFYEPEVLPELTQYAIDHGAKIINLSLSIKNPSIGKSLLSTIQNNPDVLFVVAAGNAGIDLQTVSLYPAKLKSYNLITVTSVNRNGQLSEFSNFNPNYVDIACLGERVRSTKPNSGSGEVSGTSFAAPFVARIAADIMASFPSLSPKEIVQVMKSTALQTRSLQGKVQAGILSPARAFKESAALASRKNSPPEKTIILAK